MLHFASDPDAVLQAIVRDAIDQVLDDFRDGPPDGLEWHDTFPRASGVFAAPAGLAQLRALREASEKPEVYEVAMAPEGRLLLGLGEATRNREHGREPSAEDLVIQVADEVADAGDVETVAPAEPASRVVRRWPARGGGQE